MQQPEKPDIYTQAPIRPSRLIKNPHQFINTDKGVQHRRIEEPDVAALPTAIVPAVKVPLVKVKPTYDPDATIVRGMNVRQWQQTLSADDPDASIPPEALEIGSMNTMRLMQLSGVMRAVRLPESIATPTQGYGPTVITGALAEVWRQNLPMTPSAPVADRYNSYPPEFFGKTRPLGGAEEVVQQPAQAPSGLKRVLNMPVVRYALGILVGFAFLFLVSRFINIGNTITVLRQNLTTTQGMLDALGAAVAFISAFCIRGVRWSFFLRPVKRVSPLKTIRIFWIAVFMNFLLPVQGGEVIKTFLLKRTDGVPISQSLPTVAMDKSLDLMPALFLMAVMPFIPGIHMTLPLWLILALVSSILIGVLFTVFLTAWNRTLAIKFIQTMLKLLPKGVGAKIEGFALGFVDSLLAGASHPETFIPAILLTCGALACDGLFAWMCFRVVGIENMSYGTAILGYTLFNMFTILPSPPGQLGSNETYGPLVFGQLLGFPKTNVLAMFLFSHPLAALIMTILCLICLGSLGISFSSVMHASPGEGDAKTKSAKMPSASPSTPPYRAYAAPQGEPVGRRV
jgi:uncharacterized protein (TIRG00374 family)